MRRGASEMKITSAHNFTVPILKSPNAPPLAQSAMRQQALLFQVGFLSLEVTSYRGIEMTPLFQLATRLKKMRLGRLS